MPREFMIDANGDNLDDIVLPDFEGLRVALQSATGFDPPALLELSAALTVSGSQATYRADEVLSYDSTKTAGRVWPCSATIAIWFSARPANEHSRVRRASCRSTSSSRTRAWSSKREISRVSIRATTR